MENLRKRLLVSLFLIVFLVSSLNQHFEVKGLVEISMTRVFNTLAYDCCLYQIGTDYTTVHDALFGYTWGLTTNVVGGQKNDSGTYSSYKSFLYWATGIMPDNANITSATISVYIMMDNSTDDFNLTIQNGQPTYPHEPIQSQDYFYLRYSGDGGSRNSSEIGGTGYFNITLNATGIEWINTLGDTKLVLRSSRDIDSTAPNSTEYVIIYTYEEGEDYAPKLYLTYATWGYKYILHGAYNEDGTFAGAINCTFYPKTEGSYTFELDGIYTVSSEAIPICFKFDLGYNLSRIYYVYGVFEEIYVIKPKEPFYNYLFELIDYVGLSWSYLETIINVNGTDRVVERWACTANEMPFTLSWGAAYTMRLVCNKGEYTYPKAYVAGATQSFTLGVTSDCFPVPSTGLSGLAASALRQNISWIQANYTDANSSTLWVFIQVFEYSETIATTNYNTTSNNVVWNWLDAASDTDYYVTISIMHSVLGYKIWSFPCPYLVTNPNPFTFLRILGTFPFDLAQMPAIIILILVALAFSWYNISIGIIVTFLFACFLVWFGWLAIGWAWLSIAGSMSFLLAFVEAKERDML